MDAQTTVDKALDVLFHLHGESAPVGVTQLGRALGLPKSSAHRLLTSLTQRGLVERDDRGRYSPGLALVALGLGALEREPVVAAARHVLESEAASLGETVFLVAARAGQLVVLDKAEGTGFLRAAPRVGATVPVHATAVGKLYLAFGAGEVARGVLEPFTPRTATRASQLDRAVAKARRRGYAENREEWIPGLTVLAAPILVRGQMRGALALAGPTARVADLDSEEPATRIRRAADRVAARLGGVAHD